MSRILSTISITRGNFGGSSRWLNIPNAFTLNDIQYEREGVQLKFQVKTNFFQIVMAFTVSLFSCIVGYSSAYTSPALASMDRDSGTIHPTAQEKSWIGSLMPLSALIGGLFGGVLIECFGRKKIIMATAVPFTASFLFIGSAVNVPLIMVGRSLAGLSVGIVSLALPLYLSETLHPDVRGMLGILPTALGNFGILLCFTIGTFVDWRILAYVGAVLSALATLPMFFMPESPLWYINNGNTEQAESVLLKLRGKNADMARELEYLHKVSAFSQMQMSAKPTDIFKTRNLWPLGILLGLMFFQQFSGINAMIFYTVEIFEEAGSTLNSNISAIIVGVVNLFSTITASFLVDKLGRKILLYISSSVMMVTLASLGILLYLKNVQGSAVENIEWMPLLTFVLFVMGFSMGAGPVPWLMMGEILPAKIRGIAASIATAFNWACTFIVTKCFVDLSEGLGPHGAFWFFSAICLLFLIFTIIFVPETQGKSLQEIERKFTKDGRHETQHKSDTLRRTSSTRLHLQKE